MARETLSAVSRLEVGVLSDFSAEEIATATKGVIIPRNGKPLSVAYPSQQRVELKLNGRGSHVSMPHHETGEIVRIPLNSSTGIVFRERSVSFVPNNNKKGKEVFGGTIFQDEPARTFVSDDSVIVRARGLVEERR